jgi:bacillopeptidase F (M6 metalloprotease family)
LTGSSGYPALTSNGLLAPEYTEHTADISAFGGKSVQLRFAYTSDSGTNHENFYVDDVSIVDSGGGVLFTDDMETSGSWTRGGTPGFAWVTAESSAAA